MAQDSGSAKTRFEEFGRKVDERVGEAIPRVEEEVKKVIHYLNDEVVPQVRQNSSQALRVAAEHLQRLAEHLDKRRP
jgi:predicted transcriptional regulator